MAESSPRYVTRHSSRERKRNRARAIAGTHLRTHSHLFLASAVPLQVCSRFSAVSQADALRPRLCYCCDQIWHQGGTATSRQFWSGWLRVWFWMLPVQHETTCSLNRGCLFVCCVTNGSFSGVFYRALKYPWSGSENSACFYSTSIVDLSGAWGILCYSLCNCLARYYGPNRVFHKLGG